MRSRAGARSTSRSCCSGTSAASADAARELGVEHVGGLALTEHGTPRLDSAFALADGVARFPLRCFVNADIILGPDLLTATRAVSAQRRAVPHRRRVVSSPSTSRGAAALDWFVFPAGLFGELPPFAIGRACFDNWLRLEGAPGGHRRRRHARRRARSTSRTTYDHVAGGKRRGVLRRGGGAATSSSPAARSTSTRSTTRATSSAAASSAATTPRSCAGATLRWSRERSQAAPDREKLGVR